MLLFQEIHLLEQDIDLAILRHVMVFVKLVF